MADSDDSSSSGGSDVGYGQPAGSDVDSDEGQPDMIPVEFESVACEADDFHRMQPLLSQLVRKSDVNVSTIIDVILSQPTMGAVIKVCPPDAEPNSGSAGEKEKAGAAKKEMAEAAAAEKEAGAAGDGVTEDADGSAVDETVYSMTTLLNLHEHKKVAGVQQLIKWITSKCTASDKDKFTALVEKNVVGWLINERFMNLPPQLAPPSLRSLLADIKDAVEKGEPYKVDYILLLSKSMEMVVEAPAGAGGGKAKRQAVSEKILTNPEDEVFEKRAVFTTTFALPNTDPNVVHRQYRTAMLIPASQMPVIMEGIDALIDTGACNIESLPNPEDC